MSADLALLWDQARDDPVLLYSAAAALLLAVVSLSSGIARRDFLALGRPRTVLRVLGAVAVAILLKVLEVWLGPTLPESAAAVTSGLHRLPLYLVALAYGPATGAAVGVLFAGFAASASLPGWPEAVLALELAVLGWLAIYPSPRDTRIAGPSNAILAYLLAWGTAGIALLASANETVTARLLLSEHAAMVPGLLVCAALLLVPGPRAYARAFPGSRIYPPTAHRSRTAAHGAGRRPSTAPVAAVGLDAPDPFAARDARSLTLSTLTFEPSGMPQAWQPSRARRDDGLGFPHQVEPLTSSGAPRRRRRLEPRRLPEEFSR